MKTFVLLLASVGGGLILFGSYVAIVAPGDGQTGMVAWPAWFFGGIAGVVALVAMLASSEARSTWPVVTGLALLSGLSVGVAVYTSFAYTRESKKSHASRKMASDRDEPDRPSSEAKDWRV